MTWGWAVITCFALVAVFVWGYILGEVKGEQSREERRR